MRTVGGLVESCRPYYGECHAGQGVARGVAAGGERLRALYTVGTRAVLVLPGVAHQRDGGLRLRRLGGEQQGEDRGERAQPARGADYPGARRWTGRVRKREDGGEGRRPAPPVRRSGSARLGSARLGSARLGSARLGSARLGSARLGSARLGSARLGSARLRHYKTT